MKSLFGSNAFRFLSPAGAPFVFFVLVTARARLSCFHYEQRRANCPDWIGVATILMPACHSIGSRPKEPHLFSVAAHWWCNMMISISFRLGPCKLPVMGKDELKKRKEQTPPFFRHSVGVLHRLHISKLCVQTLCKHKVCEPREV